MCSNRDKVRQHFNIVVGQQSWMKVGGNVKPTMESAWQRGFIIGTVVRGVDTEDFDAREFMHQVNLGLDKAYEYPVTGQERALILTYLARMALKVRQDK